MRLDRYDRNHRWAMLQIPKVDCSRCNRIEWLTVTNAAVMSNRMRSDTSPRSAASSMSESTRNTAVSVECPDRNPDCKDGKRSRDDRYLISWRATRRSKSLEPSNWKLADRKRRPYHRELASSLLVLRKPLWKQLIAVKFKFNTQLKTKFKTQIILTLDEVLNVLIYGSLRFDEIHTLGIWNVAVMCERYR